MKDTYQTVAELSTGEYKDRGSKFIAYAYPVYTEEEVKERLEALKKEHFKARHHCYAYRLGLDGKRFRANDDGEPSGTAGRPILGQIDSFGLTNVLVVSVRYYGGTKLGTSGLKNAYKGSTREALENATIEEKIVESILEVTFDYGVTSDVMNYLKSDDFPIVGTRYEEKTILRVRVRNNMVEEVRGTLKKIIGVKVEIED